MDVDFRRWLDSSNVLVVVDFRRWPVTFRWAASDQDPDLKPGQRSASVWP